MQWSGSRNVALRAYASSCGESWTSETIQIKFMVAEIKSGVYTDADQYASVQFMDKTSYYGSSLATESAFWNSTSIDDITTAFCYSWERPNASKVHLNERIEAAYEYYEMFKDAERPTSTGTQTAEYWESLGYESNSIGVSCPRYYQSGRSWSSVTLSCTSGTKTISGYRMWDLCSSDGSFGADTERKLLQMSSLV